MQRFVSRAGLKLEHALATWNLPVAGAVCADLGCNAGGFVDCLLRRGAATVFAIDTGYGMLDWKLRNDARVVVMERTNAMHVELPAPVDGVSIDVAWTRQSKILPSARRLVKPGGWVVTLIKPHYEAQQHQLRRGLLPEELLESVVAGVLQEVEQIGFKTMATVRSPIVGGKGNIELLAWLAPAPL